MAKKNGKTTDLAVAEPAPLPAYLQGHTRVGLESQGESQMQARIKIIQSSANKDLKSEFAEGSVIMTPDTVLIAEPAAKFLATPIYRWTTWAKLRDGNDPAEDFILDESGDVNGELAKRAKNPASRKEKYDSGKYEANISERLNWIFLLHGGVAPGELCSFTYAVGGWSTGARLLRTLQRHKAPIWSYLLELGTESRTNKSGKDYWVLNFTLPKTYLCAEKYVKSLEDYFNNAHSAFEAGALAAPIERDETAKDATDAAEEVAASKA